MKVTLKDIEYLAELSHFILDEEEKQISKKYLNEIVNYIDKINGLNTDELNSFDYLFSTTANRFRRDEIRPSMDRDSILRNAPNSLNGYFKVPIIID